MQRIIASFCLCLSLIIAVPSLGAADARSNALLDKLGMRDMVAIMRQEGLGYAQTLADDMLPGGNSATWTQNVNRIYDETDMQLLVQGGFAKALEGVDLDAIEQFFDTELATRIVELEISARRAMLDDDIEDAAKQSAALLAKKNDPRHALIDKFIDAGDMLEANVVSALNSNIGFYQGLVDGGAFKLTEAEIVSDVWSQEDETRAETRDWLFGFFLMAYDPLSMEDAKAFVDFSATPDGQKLTRAIFAAYDLMYADISYALGLAVAREMQAEEI